jgi:hypothetical protein
MLRRLTAIAIAVGGLGGLAPTMASGKQVCSKHHGKRVCQKVRAAPAPPPIRASGYVTGRGIVTVTSAELKPGPKPEIRGAKLTAGKPGSPLGVYCLILRGAPANTSQAIVTLAGTGPITGVPIVEWVPYAPDCAGNAVEVQTSTTSVSGGQLVMTPSNLVDFSFLIPS